MCFTYILKTYSTTNFYTPIQLNNLPNKIRSQKQLVALAFDTKTLNTRQSKCLRKNRFQAYRGIATEFTPKSVDLAKFRLFGQLRCCKWSADKFAKRPTTWLQTSTLLQTESNKRTFDLRTKIGMVSEMCEEVEDVWGWRTTNGSAVDRKTYCVVVFAERVIVK